MNSHCAIPSDRADLPSRNKDLLLGNWRLSRLATTHSGAVSQPLGAEPTGHLSYQPDGRMAVHLCKEVGVTSDVAMPDFVAYCGRYTLDRLAGTVMHHIEAGSMPHLAGTDQIRHFQLGRDRLILSAETPRGKTVLEWLRTGDPAAAADLPPQGFEPMGAPGVSPGRAGRYFVKDRDGPSPVVGTRIGVNQSNREGFAHGGFLLAFADFATTIIVSGITLNLSADFMRPARIGDWIEARIITRKRSAGLIFADAITTCEGRDLLRITGLFKPFGKST